MESGAAAMMTWSKAGVIAEALGSIGIVFTLFYSVWSFTTTLRDAYYAEIDRVYFELLKIGLERPELLAYPTSPTSPASPDPAKASQYGAYAFMVWNFVETIFDRTPGLVEATPARDLVPDHRLRERSAPRVVRAAREPPQIQAALRPLHRDRVPGGERSAVGGCGSGIRSRRASSIGRGPRLTVRADFPLRA